MSPLVLPSRDDLTFAVHVLSYAMQFPDTWSETRQLFLALAPKMEQGGYRHEWVPMLESGIRLSEEQNDVGAQAELGLQLAMLHQLLARYEQAEHQLQLCLAQFKAIGHVRGEARALNRLAYVAWRRHQLTEAEHTIQAALHLLPDTDPERAYSYFVLGAIELTRRSWQQAAHCLERSLDLRRSSTDGRNLAWALSNLGFALWRLEQHDAAIARLQEAIEVFKAIGDPIHLAVATLNLGNVYFSRDQFEAASRCYRESEPVFRKAQDLTRLAKVCNNLGKAYHALGAWEKAIDAYHQSIVVWQRLDDSIGLANVSDNLGLVFLAQNQYESATQVFQGIINRLSKIESAPDRDHFLNLACEHLEETRQKSELAVQTHQAQTDEEKRMTE